MTSLTALKKDLLKIASKNKLDKKDKTTLDRVLKTIKDKYIVVMVRNNHKKVYPVHKK